MRIDIVGPPASGKSMLAEAISKKLSIPHMQIDRFWFEAGGRQGSHDTPNIEEVRAHIRKKVLENIIADSWVSDGFYSRVQSEIAQRAEIILVLDIPLWKRLFNHARRITKPSTRHKELSAWQELTFFFEIIRRTFKNRGRLEQFISDYKNKVVVLKSYKEIDRYLETLN